MSQSIYENPAVRRTAPTSRSRRLMTLLGVSSALFSCNLVTRPYDILADGQPGCYVPIGQDGANTRSEPILTIPPDNNIVGEIDPNKNLHVTQVTDAGEFIRVTEGNGQTFYIHRRVTSNGGHLSCR